MKLELYYRPTCPFCQKVLAFLEENGIKLELKDISSDAKNFQTLISVGGKQQVPCLFVDGVPMYESGDIINWLRDNL